MEQNPGKQSKDLAGLLSKPVDTIKKQIKKLVDNKLIERRGSKKTGGCWIIKNK